MLVPVIQQETTGCGIAAVATILGKSYLDMKIIANAKGIYAEDESLWSETGYVRQLLYEAGVQVAAEETPFESWDALPDLALLPIKHHQRNGREFWHWTVFQRVRGEAFVLDPASYLPSNIRQDFAQMHPQWFIQVYPSFR